MFYVEVLEGESDERGGKCVSYKWRERDAWQFTVGVTRPTFSGVAGLRKRISAEASREG